MKTIWKVLLGIGAVIAGILAMSSKGNKKQFKKDVKSSSIFCMCKLKVLGLFF